MYIYELKGILLQSTDLLYVPQIVFKNYMCVCFNIQQNSHV